MKILALAFVLIATMATTTPKDALAASAETLNGFECRYNAVDSRGGRLVELGHILTSDINGQFETRSLGFFLSPAPSARIYTWQQGANQVKQLYIELYDSDDNSRRDSQLVDVTTEMVSVALSAHGFDAVLTCKAF